MIEHVIKEDYITCDSCGTIFERSREYTSCSNCFVCTGCEIYYCPGCDNEIVITPVLSKYKSEDPLKSK
jgi:hypothetical protein